MLERDVYVYTGELVVESVDKQERGSVLDPFEQTFRRRKRRGILNFISF